MVAPVPPRRPLARDPEGAGRPVARKLLEGEFADGDVIAVKGGEGRLEIGKAQRH